MIQHLVLDVDGVLIGSKKGVNAPDPHPDIVAGLKARRQAGIGVSLVTAKPFFAIESIVRAAQLNGPHVTDAGAALIDSMGHEVDSSDVFDAATLTSVLAACQQDGFYAEIYTANDYVIERKQQSELTVTRHTMVLGRAPTVVDAFTTVTQAKPILKIVLVARTGDEKVSITQLHEQLRWPVTLRWTVHPSILPLEFAVLTPPGVSKRGGVRRLADTIAIPLPNMLGVGDSLADWDFIELCGYGAAMGNAESALKNHVLSKGEEKGFVGPSVDDNGLPTILNHFLGPVA